MKRVACALLAFLIWALPFEPFLIHVRAAITISELVAEGDTANTTSDATTGTFSLTSGELGICFTANTDGAPAEEPTTLTQTGQSWTKISAVTSTDTIQYLTAWRDTGAGAAAAVITTDVGGADNQTGWVARCYEVTGADLTGGEAAAILQTKAVAVDNTASPTATLDSGRTANSALLFTAFSNAACTYTEEAGYTLGTQVGYVTPTMQSQTQFVVGGSDTTPTMGGCSSTTDHVVFAVEVKAPAAGGSGAPHDLLLLGVGR